MNHIVIKQDTTGTEEVSSAVITALYNAVNDEYLDNNSDLQGRLHSSAGYESQVEYLTHLFSNLYITCDSTYIDIEDAEVLRILNANGFTDGVGVTAQLARNANLSGKFDGNTVIQSFRTFRYFEKANTNPPINLFRNCSNLSDIDLSRVTSISVSEFAGTSLSDVNCPELQNMGSGAFRSCSSLETVTNLGEILQVPGECFRESRSLESVTLPSTCVSIGNSAFLKCSNLNTINLSNILSIGSVAFQETLLNSVNMSDLRNVQTIDQQGFTTSNIKGIVDLPNLTSLGQQAFYGCNNLTQVKCLGKISSVPTYAFCSYGNQRIMNITSVYLPYECTTIGNQAFYRNEVLTTVKKYNKSIDAYEENEEPVYNNLSTVTSFGNECFYEDSLLNLTSSDISGSISIGSKAFSYSGFNGVVNLPNLTSLGSEAFANTGVTSITNLGSITSIPAGCFRECTSLTTVTLGNSTTYGSSCFYNCINLESVPNFPTTIPEGLFRGCTKLQATVANSITIIGHFGLKDCSSLTFPSTVNVTTDGKVGHEFFRQCKLTNVILSSNTTHLHNSCFSDCTSLVNIQGLENITHLGSFCFNNCVNLEGDIDLSNVVGAVAGRYDNAENYFGEGLFAKCSKITSVKLGDIPCFNSNTHRYGVQGCQFLQCTSLHTVDIKSVGYFTVDNLQRPEFWECGGAMRNFIIRSTTVPTINGGIENLTINHFGGSQVTIYVPDSAVQDYKTAWPNLASYIDSINNYVEIQ